MGRIKMLLWLEWANGYNKQPPNKSLFLAHGTVYFGLVEGRSQGPAPHSHSGAQASSSWDSVIFYGLILLCNNLVEGERESGG